MSNLPKGIRKRGQSYIVDVTYKGERRTATCLSLSEANLKRTALLSELHTGRGGVTPTGGLTPVCGPYRKL